MRFTQGHTASERSGAALLPTRHRAGFLIPGQLTPTQLSPEQWGHSLWLLCRGLAEAPRRLRRSRPDGLGAVRGADPHAGSCSPSGWRVPQVSLPAPSRSQLGEFRWAAGVLRPSSQGSRGSLSPPPTARASSLPSPQPAPPTVPPRQSQVPPLPPYLSRPLSSPLRLVRQFRSRCWVFTPGGCPRPPSAPRSSPGAPVPRPCSLGAADGAAAGAGAAEPRAQLARGRRAPPPARPADPGLLWPVAPSGPEGEEARGPGGWAPRWPQ